MKPSCLKEHLTKIHPEVANKECPIFQALKEKHGKRRAIQEHLIELQCDVETHAGYPSLLWLGQHVGQICHMLPGTLGEDQAASSCFSNHIVEQEFSHMQTKFRNRLDLMGSGALHAAKAYLSAARSEETGRQTPDAGLLSLTFKTCFHFVKHL
ncbi:hypothetical protein DPEC_G00060600 [Dallia pectoralis]|uniref:Uncharacterized protein n=1 Tax=Dallia pectoralis TaxID=75939 RepID=A0ACC2H6Q8_DALPE|nr:hypothetical protein DPEC_G00060600 [Dallia pectoralis]